MKQQVTRKKNASPWVRKSANFFGALGYLIVAFQWVIALALFTPLLDLLPSQPQTIPVETPAQPTLFDGTTSIIGLIFVVVITIIMIVLTILVLVKLPAVVARSTRKVVTKSSHAVTTSVIKVTHKKDTKKRRLTIEPRVIFSIKIAALVLPLGLAYCSRFLEEPLLDIDLALFLVVIFANFALGAFIIQYAIAYFGHVDRKDIW